MRCYVNQLESKLRQGMHPVYIVMGEEPFQVQRCIDQIHAYAKKNGYDEVIKFTLLPQFDWQEVIQEYNSLSLFSTLRIIEIDLSDQKPGQPGANAFKQLSELDNQDCILIIKGEKAGQDIQKTAWFKALDAKGMFIPCYEITGNHLYQWLDSECHALQVSLTQDAKHILLEANQGNLLAIFQELEKLALIYGSELVDSEKLHPVLVNQSKFDIFDLSDAILQGEPVKIIEILTTLKQLNTEPTSVLWTLSRDAQQLLDMNIALHAGHTMPLVLKQFKVWKNKQLLFQNALNRISQQQLQNIIQLLAQFDTAFKSGSLISPWQSLAQICLSFGITFSSPLPIYKN
jgi:DNA polymerase III subunit delta